MAAEPSLQSMAFFTASTYNASLSSSLGQETGCQWQKGSLRVLLLFKEAGYALHNVRRLLSRGALPA
jgi:hypothetical protein